MGYRETQVARKLIATAAPLVVADDGMGFDANQSSHSYACTVNPHMLFYIVCTLTMSTVKTTWKTARPAKMGYL